MSSPSAAIHEFSLIRRLAALLSSPKPQQSFTGIGDDASVLRLASTHYQLATHDMLLEGVHFVRGTLADFRALGWKALAVNLSDIAAMGGRPQQALIGLGLPKGTRRQEVEALYKGLQECARKYNCPILGGDTNRSQKDWVIAVTVLGNSKKAPLLRSGAKPGESLWVTGKLGSAALGWKLIQKNDRSRLGARFRFSHQKPLPRLDWGERFLASGLVSAMIDLSDGLGGDLCHLAEVSRVGFEIEIEKIPREKNFEVLCKKNHLSELSLMLSGGEDYELLLTVKAGQEKNFQNFIARHRIEAHYIGRATSSRKIIFREAGKKISAKINGYTHF